MATYVSLDAFRPEINQFCPGSSGLLIRKHVLNACILFCERTEILKKDASEFYLTEDQHTYTLKFSGDRYVANAMDKVYYGEEGNTKALQVTTENELDHSIPRWRDKTSTEPFNYFLTTDINKLRIYPTPSADSDYEIFSTAVVRPKRDQTEVDEVLQEKWEEVIQAGALRTLLKINKASWFNARLAKDFDTEWSRGVRRARKTTISGQGKYPGRVIPQSFTVQGTVLRREGSIWD